MKTLANCYEVVGRRQEALKLREETLQLSKAKLGPDHPSTLANMANLAVSYDNAGRHQEAIKLTEETLALQKAKLGPDHPRTLNSMINLSDFYAHAGRFAEALKLADETLALAKAKLGSNHPDTLISMYNLGCLHAVMIPKSSDGTKEADLAMDWLKKAVAAGFKDVKQLKTDTDLDALRQRDDFKKLVAELEAASKDKK
jgi:tetratricopeptide (TPR) repeat protein